MRTTRHPLAPMGAPEKDQLILTLRRRGYSTRRIAAALGMSKSGVADALKRKADGRPARDPRAP